MAARSRAIIRAASEALMAAVQELTSKAYEKSAASEEAAGDDAGAEPKSEKAEAEGSVDADYEVVDD